MDKKEGQGSFWLSMINKYEKRNYELEERQCNLEQRLENLKNKVSSSHQDICSCCSKNSSSFNPTPASSSSCIKPKSVSSKQVGSNLNNIFSFLTRLVSGSQCAEGQIDQTSLASLESMDLEYIGKLYDLINREKEMKQQVREMELREQGYLETMQQADQRWACMEIKYKKRLAEQESTNGCGGKSDQLTQQLKDENADLCSQLQNAKLDLKQWVEQFEEPITRQLEQERRRSQQLENELKLTSNEVATKECCYMQDMCALQNQLKTTNQNVADINALNENLQRQMCALARKYKDLQRDLINQKINEAHTLERLNEIISEEERTPSRARRPCKEAPAQTIPEKEEKGKADVPKPVDDSLYAIARRLSKTLQDINQCDICRKSVQGDLIETITGIKIITDIVDKGNATGEGSATTPKKSPGPGPDGAPKPQKPPGPDKTKPPEEPTRDVSDEDGDQASKFEQAEEEIASEVLDEVEGEDPVDLLDETKAEPATEASEIASVDSARNKIENVKIEESDIEKHQGQIDEDVEDVCAAKEEEENVSAVTSEIADMETSKASISHEFSDHAKIEEIVPVETAVQETAPSEKDARVVTEVQNLGDVQVQVETKVELFDRADKGINVITTVTSSGMLEVVTEGPVGLIETTMTRTPSGNIEVITEITEYPAEAEQKVLSAKDKLTITEVQSVSTAFETPNLPAEADAEESVVQAVPVLSKRESAVESIPELPPKVTKEALIEEESESIVEKPEESISESPAEESDELVPESLVKESTVESVPITSTEEYADETTYESVKELEKSVPEIPIETPEGSVAEIPVEDPKESMPESSVEEPEESVLESPVEELVESVQDGPVVESEQSELESPVEQPEESVPESLVEKLEESVPESPIEELEESPPDRLGEDPEESVPESPIEEMHELVLDIPVGEPLPLPVTPIEEKSAANITHESAVESIDEGIGSETEGAQVVEITTPDLLTTESLKSEMVESVLESVTEDVEESVAAAKESIHAMPTAKTEEVDESVVEPIETEMAIIEAVESARPIEMPEEIIVAVNKTQKLKQMEAIKEVKLDMEFTVANMDEVEEIEIEVEIDQERSAEKIELEETIVIEKKKQKYQKQNKLIEFIYSHSGQYHPTIKDK